MKQLIGIENKEYEGNKYMVLHVADYEAKEGVQGARVEKHSVYNLDKVEIEGNLELGCAIRIFREGTKEYSYITMILCKPWKK